MRRAIALLALLLLALTTLGCGGEVSSLKFSPDQLPGAHVGQSYSATIAVSNNKTPVYRMAIVDGRLPAGLAFHQTKGSGSAEISGVPTAAGASTLAVSASCLGTNTTGQSGRQAYELVVN